MSVVREGYKMTEVGLIPSDWAVYRVDDLIDLLTDYDANGSFASVAENVKVYDHEEYAWYVRSTDLENKSKMNEVRYVDKTSYEFLKKTTLYGGELLFLKRGDIGKVYLFQMRSKRATVAPNLYLLKLNSISFSTYLYYFFLSQNGQSQLLSKNASSTLGALYKDDVKSVFVPLPPTLDEQRAIATALSDVDALISGLDKLIEKKKAIKQGAMQELLTGKTRLAGFGTGKGYQMTEVGLLPEDWELTPLKNICELAKTKIDPQSHKDNFKCIELEHLDQGTGQLLGHEMSKKLLSQKTLFQRGDVLFGKLRPYLRKFLLANFDGVCTSEIWVLRSKYGCENSYLYYLIQTERIVDAANASTGTKMPRAEWPVVSEVSLPLPTTLDEQRAIATVLSDMDAEIQSLETKRRKYAELKRGMMQELLTGKTRLI